MVRRLFDQESSMPCMSTQITTAVHVFWMSQRGNNTRCFVHVTLVCLSRDARARVCNCWKASLSGFPAEFEETAGKIVTEPSRMSQENAAELAQSPTSSKQQRQDPATHKLHCMCFGISSSQPAGKRERGRQEKRMKKESKQQNQGEGGSSGRAW